jgi:hypothetical protein
LVLAFAFGLLPAESSGGSQVTGPHVFPTF